MWTIISLVFLFIIKLRFPPKKSIATIITDRYGQNTVRLLIRFESLDFKLRKSQLDIDFVEKCIKNQLTPKFVQFKVANKHLRSSSAYKICQRKLLVEELAAKKQRNKHLQQRFDQCSLQLKNSICAVDFFHISH